MLQGKRAVIADDSEENLEILKNTLETAGMRVMTFMNGKDVLSAINEAVESSQPFDIGIFDARIPNMSGYDLAGQIRLSKGASMPLLAFSSSLQGNAKKSLDAGFNGFLPKPISRTKLLKMISHLLGNSTNEDHENPPAELVTQYSVIENQKGSSSILLADDNPVNQKLAATLLTKAGYSVEVVGNGREAIECFTAEPAKYDMIFMDIQMPEMNGLVATQQIRDYELGDSGFRGLNKSKINRIPIVAMTSNAIEGDREICIKSGMDDYMSKPIKREIVYEMLKKWVIDKTSTNLE